MKYENIDKRCVYLLLNVPTFNFGSSFPAKANRSVVFPELGGPKSNVILKRTNLKHLILVQEALEREINENNIICIDTWKALIFH